MHAVEQNRHGVSGRGFQRRVAKLTREKRSLQQKIELQAELIATQAEIIRDLEGKNK